MKFARPDTVAEAVAVLADDGARCLAGGQSLVAMMNANLISPSIIVSLRGIPGLDKVAAHRDGSLRLGAMALHADVARLEPAAPAASLLAQAAASIGHPAIRNQGTIGGSIAHADPAADYPTAIVCAEATVEIAGPDGPRKVAAADFFRGYYQTALGQGDMVVAVEVPPGPAGAAAHYEKFALLDGDFAVISVAVVAAMREGRCTSMRLAVGGCGPTPIRVAAAEATLLGTTLADQDTAAAGHILTAAADPVDDFRGSAEFRRKLIPRMVRRAVATAKAKLGSRHA